ncbi:class I SAM-dependent methyltransferase [Marinilabilia salmonicolor]|uniref:class I SAM-dependent methyltransferase n=1 Tax=Marinilabilia salmonicolor TaxID=989 RepID=UPI00029A0FEE|nr:class I SAM-dependent methyltransferase [Marinilabilia salmonicolor]
MQKGQISNIIRSLRLIRFADRVRYVFQLIKNRKINRKFKVANPEVGLPPDYLIYESFQINYHKYFAESRGVAKWVVEKFRPYVCRDNGNILDWGCGPGRVIRHLPDLLDGQWSCHGTDYNSKSIGWCRKNLPGIEFNNNNLDAELLYPNDFFDVIYGLSVFTHLSAAKHHEWFEELNRVLKPGGVMLFTTQGQNFREKLTPDECKRFDAGELIVRGKVKEGHRTYSAFHPDLFMLEMFANANVEVLDHEVPSPLAGRSLPQDLWIIRKPVL